MVHGAFDLLIDDSRDNSDDFMPSGPWDDDNLGNDHVDEGDAASDVEEPVNLIAKPRQVHPLPLLLSRHSSLCTYIWMCSCMFIFLCPSECQWPEKSSNEQYCRLKWQIVV